MLVKRFPETVAVGLLFSRTLGYYYLNPLNLFAALSSPLWRICAPCKIKMLALMVCSSCIRF